jgi:Gram-negative bacterial TonB protein C-terminal
MWFLSAAMVVLAMQARAGLAQADTQAVEQALKGRQLALRSHSAEQVARYQWVDDKVVAGPVSLHTVGLFTTYSVGLKRDEIVVTGFRSTLVHDRVQDKLMLTGKSPMTLEIDLRGADAAVVLPLLEGALFFPTAKDAVDGLPSQLVEMVPFRTDAKGVGGCHCTNIFEDGKWVRLESSDHSVTTPRVIQFPKTVPGEAGENGLVTLVLHVMSTGHVEDIWIARSAGTALDDAAVLEARQYVFTPASHNGQAVGTQLVIERNAR